MNKQADFYRMIASSEDCKFFDSLSQPETEFHKKNTEREELFYDFKKLAHQIQNCGAVVQNEGQTTTERELAEWSKMSANLVVDFGKLLTKTKTFLKN